jgi:hypothetical protein
VSKIGGRRPVGRGIFSGAKWPRRASCAYLWMLPEHVSQIVFTTRDQRIQPGTLLAEAVPGPDLEVRLQTLSRG